MNQVFKNILVVQDAYRDTVYAMEWASRMLSPTAHVSLLDVQPPLSEFWTELFRFDFEQTPLSHRKKALAEIAKGVEFPTSNFTARVRRGTPVVEIVRECLGGKFDLVIKEAFSRSSEMIFGSLDLRLMRHCPAPLWLVNPEMGDTCKRILVALNPEAEDKEMQLNQRLLDYAAKLALGFDCKLYVVAAYHNQEMAFPILDRDSIDRVEKHSKSARTHVLKKLKQLLEKSPKQIDPKNIILEDSWPENAILDAVDNVKPELLVMGSVARHGITGLLVGNTAERVLRQVDCSILTIKPAGFVSPIRVDAKELGNSGECQLAF